MSKDQELQEIRINLNEKDKINEDRFTRSLGVAIQNILKRLFGSDFAIPVKIVGTKEQVDLFSKAIAGEKGYVDSITKYGLDNPKTYASKSWLSKAVDSFQKTTGIKWPFGK